MEAAYEEIERRRQLGAKRGALWIAAVIPLFVLVDWAAIGQFSLPAALLRVMWAVALVALVLPFPTERRKYKRSVRLAVALSTVAIAAIAGVSGGSSSMLFAALPALPAVVVALLQDDGATATVAGVSSVLGMALVLGLERAPLAFSAAWLLFGVGMAWVGWFGGRLFLRRQQEMVELERMRLEAMEQLALSERRRGESERLALVGQLAAGVAHEVNNPLAFVKANLHFLNAELRPSDPEHKQALEDAAAGVQRIEQIVRDLRAFSRSDSSDHETDFQVGEVVEEAVRIAAVRMKTLVRPVAETAPDLPPVRGVHGRLLQVLVNLLVNAADALEELRPPREHPRVLVRVWAEEPHVLIAVEDNGPGLPEKVLARAFEPFFTTKPAGKGTGLGLALSREYVERLGGTLTVTNLPEGGARFLVKLPAAKLEA